jgi:protein O-mannosyl-transferase
MKFLPKREIGISIGLALATAFTFAGVVSNGFVNLDDDYYVYRNAMAQIGLRQPAISWAFTTLQYGNWHPLTWLSLQLDYQIFGLNPSGYHATNLLLHIANTLVLFWLFRTMTGAAGRSACVAAFFALHPLHVESVAWISERKDVLSTFFLFVSIFAWYRYTLRPNLGAYLLVVVLFTLSLMAKVMGATLPLLLLLLDIWPLKRWQPWTARPRRLSSRLYTARRLVAEKIPFFLVSALFAAIAVLSQERSGALDYGQSLTFSNRLLMVPVNYATYLEQTFWPMDLAVLYAHPGADLPLWKPLCSGLVLALVSAAVAWLRLSRPYLLVGWCWFLVTLVPVIGLLQVGLQSTADRYMYMPMVGLLIAICWGFGDLVTLRGIAPIVAVAGIVALLFCAVLTRRQVALWHDSVTLWEHALSLSPPTFLSCNNYGLALDQQGRLEEAEKWYRKAIEIEPTNFYPNCNLGVLLSKKGRQKEALRHLEIALQSQPNDPLLLENLGVVEELLGRYDTAIQYYERSARIDPRSPRIHRHLGRVYKYK